MSEQSVCQTFGASVHISRTLHAYFDSLKPDQDLSWASSESFDRFQTPSACACRHLRTSATSNFNRRDQYIPRFQILVVAPPHLILCLSAPISIKNHAAMVTDQSWSAGASSDISRASTIDVRAIQFRIKYRYVLDVEQAGKPGEPLLRCGGRHFHRLCDDRGGCRSVPRQPTQPLL